MRARFRALIAAAFLLTGCAPATQTTILILCDCKDGVHENKGSPPSVQVEEKIVPLCPAIAELSYPDVKKNGETINYFLFEEAKRQKVSVEAFSSYSARLHGRRDKVASVVKNYPKLLCAFNHSLEPNDQSTYTSCMAHAKDWMDIIEKSPEELMLNDLLFKENCVIPG